MYLLVHKYLDLCSEANISCPPTVNLFKTWLKDSYTMLLTYGKIKLGAATLPDPPAGPPNGGSEGARAHVLYEW